MRATAIIIPSLTLLVVLFAGATFADQSLNKAISLFYQGNNFYNQENFEKSIHCYEEALDLGYDSGALYYNLGNAYFKKGMLGKSILNYLRAKRFIPNDADLNSNLSYARSLIGAGMVKPHRMWFIERFIKLADSFTLDNITVISSIVYVCLIFFIVFATIFRRFYKQFVYMDIVCVLVLIISLLIFVYQLDKNIYKKYGVIVSKNASVKFEPFDEATTYFTLYEGEEIVVIVMRDKWAKIKRADGKQGWVKKNSLELL